MTNFAEDDQDDYESEEVEDQKEEDHSLKLKFPEYERQLEALETLRGLLLKETERWEENSESDASSSSVVVVGEGREDVEEPAYRTILNRDNHLASEDSEGDEDAKSCFTCPFCYVDIEVPMLCNHLEEEHCFDFKNAVCPLCAANLGKDVIGHFMVHHASSFKNRRKSQKSGSWTGSSAMLGKQLLKSGRAYAQESAPDPLLSPFICNLAFSDTTSIPEDVSSDVDSPITSGLKSAKSSSVDEVCEKDIEERRQKVAFAQQLITSTIFSDL